MRIPVWARHPRFNDIVGDAIEAEVIGDGYAFTEGPVWYPRERRLVFSDIPADRLHVWRPGGPVADRVGEVHAHRVRAKLVGGHVVEAAVGPAGQAVDGVVEHQVELRQARSEVLEHGPDHAVAAVDDDLLPPRRGEARGEERGAAL